MMTLGFDAKVMMATLTLISKLKICEGQMRGSVKGSQTKGELVREPAKGPGGGREPGQRLTDARPLESPFLGNGCLKKPGK